MIGNDLEYHRQRAQIELQMAFSAVDAKARRVHYTLASHYLDRASKAEQSLVAANCARDRVDRATIAGLERFRLGPDASNVFVGPWNGVAR